MKTLRYLLITIGLVSVLSIYSQTPHQLPVLEMRSTSIITGSDSSLPMAAQTGVMLTGENLGTYTPANPPGNGPRRIGGNTSGGSEGREDPYADPLGDVLWPLMALACAYGLVRVYRRKRAR